MKCVACRVARADRGGWPVSRFVVELIVDLSLGKETSSELLAGLCEVHGAQAWSRLTEERGD